MPQCFSLLTLSKLASTRHCADIGVPPSRHFQYIFSFAYVFFFIKKKHTHTHIIQTSFNNISQTIKLFAAEWQNIYSIHHNSLIPNVQLQSTETVIIQWHGLPTRIWLSDSKIPTGKAILQVTKHIDYLPKPIKNLCSLNCFFLALIKPGIHQKLTYRAKRNKFQDKISRKTKKRPFIQSKGTPTFSNSKLLWISTSVGPATDIGFVTPYCFTDCRGGESPNPFELTIPTQNKTPKN